MQIDNKANIFGDENPLFVNFRSHEKPMLEMERFAQDEFE